MNRSSRVIWKAIAVFISFISFCVLELSVFAVYVGVQLNFFTESKQEIIRDSLSGHLDMKCEDLYFFLEKNDGDGIHEAEDYFKDQNFVFDVFNSNGELVFSTRNGEDYMLSKKITVGSELNIVEYDERDMSDDVINNVYKVRAADAFDGSSSTTVKYILNASAPSFEAVTDADNITAVGYIPASLDAEDDILTAYTFIDVGYELRFVIIIIGALSLLVLSTAFVFLMCTAGHRPNIQKIILSPFDVIPFDLYCIIFYIIAIIELGLYRSYLPSVAVLVLLPIDYLLALTFFISLSARIKSGGLFKNTFIFMAGKTVAVFIVKLCRLIFKFVISLSVHWKCSLIFFGIFLIVFLCYGLFGAAAALALSTVLFFMLLCLAIKVLVDYNEIRRGVDRISSGELYHKIPTEKLLPSSRSIAERINSIQENLQSVLESGIKSERFKTELITNVSHDLKTPLTSIINYVDLIAKESLASDKLREYVSVLERQAKRLKKLTEDLVEASKASTGNVDIEYSVCELGELLTQTFGEYSERLEAEGLVLCPKLADEPVEIFADGKHLWRILDNIMSNTVKYALPSTRVWVSLTVENGIAVIVFKNISKEVIDLSGAELTERFVRADASRNSEGSGLGLSIVKSLTELQGGEFSVTVDGDLFKATVKFPIYDGDTR